MATRVRSYSKINLGLAVGPVRADGFHGLATVYQTLALHDLVTVTAKRAGATMITMSGDHPGVPLDSRNTAWKMVAGALKRMGLDAWVHVDIQKRLPVQGGMGAGSANAAAALIGLERELDQRLAGSKRMQLAAEVGSDVPLFLVGGTVLGTGRGEVVSELPDLPRTHCVMALPGVGVSTPQAFRELDERMASGRSPQGLKPAALRGLVGRVGDPALPGGLDGRVGDPALPAGADRQPLSVALDGRVGDPALPAGADRQPLSVALDGRVGDPALPAGADRQPLSVALVGRVGDPALPAGADRQPLSVALDGRVGDPAPPAGAGIAASGGSEGGGKFWESAETLTSGGSVDKLEELSRVLSAVFTTGVKESGPSGISRTASPATAPLMGIGTANDLAENTLLALVRTGIENDFEEVAFSQHPFLRDIKRQLMGSDSGNPAMYAGLSGSGSALFGLYKSEADALAAQHRVQSNGTQAILTETLPRTEYWNGMFAE